jgi:multimeric flavodoxin WrbA
MEHLRLTNLLCPGEKMKRALRMKCQKKRLQIQLIGSRIMKLLGISTSNRRDGNSYLLLKEILSDAEIIQFADLEIKPCTHCWESCGQVPFKCVVEDDLIMVLDKMKSTDGIIISCPLYFYIPSKFQAFIERLVCLEYYTKAKHPDIVTYPLSGKLCGLIVNSGAGGHNTLDALRLLTSYVLSLHMHPLIIDKYPYLGISAKGGDEKGEILKDQNALKQAKELVGLVIKEIENKRK